MIHTGDDFAYPLVTLREAKGVKFGDFLSPGETLEITVELSKDEGPLVSVKAKACKGQRITVAARMVMERKLTGDPERLDTDNFIRGQLRKQFSELFGQVISATA